MADKAHREIARLRKAMEEAKHVLFIRWETGRPLQILSDALAGEEKKGGA